MEISLEQAQEVILEALTKAREIGVPVNIVVLDTAGFLKAFARMDAAVLGSIDIAMQKAKTSMLFGLNSEDVGGYLKPEVAAYGLVNTNGGLLGFAGGRPVRFKGQIIGYIGVSGGAIPQDAAIAVAASKFLSGSESNL
ncbi:MAG TPA: heme-binding protein [Puia sp.]|nr:heme-binding protein [Puia sp.]